MRIVEVQKNAACQTVKKYIICGVFPTIFYIENTFLLCLLVIPNTPVTMGAAQQKMEIKS